MSGWLAPEATTEVAAKAKQNKRYNAGLQNELECIISVVGWYSVWKATEALNGVLPYYQLILARDSTLDGAVVCMPETPSVPE